MHLKPQQTYFARNVNGTPFCTHGFITALENIEHRQVKNCEETHIKLNDPENIQKYEHTNKVCALMIYFH